MAYTNRGGGEPLQGTGVFFFGGGEKVEWGFWELRRRGGVGRGGKLEAVGGGPPVGMVRGGNEQ